MYLTVMNAQTRISAKGQVVIPKDTRDRLGLTQGVVLDVIETPDGVLLREPRAKQKLSFEETTARIRKIVKYDGPMLTIDQLSWSAEAEREFRKRKHIDG
ncbi:AbrB/MazE/SpoVT family DNA-binding domain-containing protein [Sphingorhabdus sp. IMCC26285]|uniref:AbrB/MazE/SpoVT family DNA-binding domain-containing protein n=2 Tax=Sphingorhabdus profundilacus TaxID=2509718 RepID=A0A6I4LXM5_9SPHN|nr:AbrB/MazE/SpoVT family DNA-binding domain-containing protein [Sphingorhabdus profundilacus]